MSELPEVRRADCGHGFLPIDTPPAARVQNGQHEQPVYLCDDCRAGLSAPGVEHKDIRPARPAAIPVEAKVASSPPAAKQNGEAYELGRQAARDRRSEEDCPYADRRTKEAREWLRGFRFVADAQIASKPAEKQTEAPRKG